METAAGRWQLSPTFQTLNALILLLQSGLPFRDDEPTDLSWRADIALSLFSSFLQRNGQYPVDSTIIKPFGFFYRCPKHFLDVIEENNAKRALGDHEYALKSPEPLDDDGIGVN